MVNSHCAVNDFVKSVAVNITDTKIVVTLICVFDILILVSKELPTLNKFIVNYVICNKHCRTTVVIVTSAHYNARIFTVKICHAGKETVNSVTPRVAPFTNVASRRVIIDSIHNFACFTVEQCQVFRTFKNESVLISVIRVLVTDYVTLAVNSCVCGFAYKFCLTVIIKVIHHKLCIV